MSALTQARETRHIGMPRKYATVRPVAAGATIYAGGLVAINASGEYVPASDSAGLRVVGRAPVTAQAGENLEVEWGVFAVDNSTGNAVAANQIGEKVFVEDDQTVGTDGGVNSIVAGVVYDVTAEGVWVCTGPDGVGAALGQ